VRNGAGRIIDSEQEVGGYPQRPETRAPFIEADWDLGTRMISCRPSRPMSSAESNRPWAR
jgi:hypothetical protein